MGKVTNYRDLIAWQKAMDLALQVSGIAVGLPDRERFVLSEQLRRAVVSIPANIAEGQGRWSSREFVHHLSIAHGSLREVETHLLRASRLGYLNASGLESVLALASEVGRLINGLADSLADGGARVGSA
jgi:four helix bundle protein